MYWLSDDDVLDSSDIRLNDFIDNVKALAIGEEQEKREVVYIPKGTRRVILPHLSSRCQ